MLEKKRMKEMKRYLRPRMLLSYALLATTLLLLLYCILGSLGVVQINQLEGWYTIPMLMGIITIVLSIDRVIRLVRYCKQMDRFKKDNQITQLVHEYEMAKPYLDGRIRLGSMHIFGKNSGRVISYDEIVCIYEYRHSTNGIRDERKLRVDFANKKYCDICQLHVRFHQEKEEDDLVRLILQKNPEITWGA